MPSPSLPSRGAFRFHPRYSLRNRSFAAGLIAAAAAFSTLDRLPLHAASDAYSTTATSGLFSNSFTDGTATPAAGGTASPASGDALFFGTETSGVTTVSNDLSAFTFAGITFLSGASAFTINGNGFTLTAALTNNSTNVQTINANISLPAQETIATSTGGGNVILGGTLSGVGNVAPSGAGIVFITGTGNTNSGSDSLGSGTLSVPNIGITGSASSLGTAGIINGGALAGVGKLVYTGTGETTNKSFGMTSSATNGIIIDQSGSGPLVITGGASGVTQTTAKTFTLQGSTAATAELRGVIGNGTSAAVSLIKAGTGTWILSGANTYSGATTVGNGILNIQNNTALGSTAAGTTVAAGATLQIQGGITTSAEALTVSGTGFAGQNGVVVNVSGANNFAGLVTLGAPSTISSDSGSLNLTNTGTITGSGFGLTLTGSGGGSVAGIIGTGAGGLIKSGSGAWTLSGANSYTGSTQVSGGSLILGGAGSINGSSGITISGSGARFVQTSSVASTPAITLTQGVLDGTGAVGAVTVGAGTGGVISNGNGTSAVLTIGSLTFNGAGSFLLDPVGGSSFTTPAVSITGALVASGGPGSLVLNTAAPSTPYVSGSTYDLIQYGSFAGDSTFFTTGTIAGISSRQNAVVGATNGFVTLTITGDSPKWTGLDNGNWVVGTTGANHNWKLITSGSATDYIEGDVVLFDDSAAGTTALNISAATVSPTSVTFNNSAKAYSISSSGTFGIAGTGSLTKNGSGTLTINTVNSYSGGTTINAGTVVIGGSAALGTGAATLNGGTLEAAASFATSRNFNLSGSSSAIQVDAADTYSVGGIVADGTSAGTLTKNGPGTLALTNLNTYSGGSVINAGTVQINGPSSLGAASGAATINAATLEAITTFSSTRNFVLGSGASVIQVDPTFNYTISGTLADGASAGTLNKAGAGVLTLTGSNTYSGGTFINAGTVAINNVASLGAASGTATINASGTLEATASFTSPRNFALGGTSSAIQVDTGVNYNISGALADGASAGSLNLTGPGTLTVTGSSSYTGKTNIAAGALQVGSGGTTGALPTGSAIVDNGLLAFNRTNAVAQGVDFSGAAITGSGSLIQEGTGSTLTLTASNSYTGGTTIGNGQQNASVLRAAASGALGTGAVTFDLGGNASQARLEVTGGITLSNPISFTARNNASVGIENISGNNTLSGLITLGLGGPQYLIQSDAGSLALSNSGTSTINLNKVVTLSGTGNGTSAGAWAGAGGISKTGPGVWTLSGNSSYTGVTNVTAGTLLITGALAGTGTSNVSTSGTLEVDGSVNLNATNLVSGFGSAIQGSGSLGTVNISNGGEIQPGLNSTVATSGTMRITGNLIADSSSLFSIRLGVAQHADNDQLAITSGTAVLGSSSLQLTLGNNFTAPAAAGFTYIIINGGYSSTGSGTFFNGSTITDPNGDLFNILYGYDPATQTVDANGTDVALQFVPEPETWALLLGALPAFGAWAARRRRRS